MSGGGLDDLAEAFGAAVFERDGSGHFRLRNDPPEWMRRLHGSAVARGLELDLANRYPFLENFLLDAEPFWRSGSAGRLGSGLWIEQDANGREMHLEAFALCAGGTQALLLVRALEGGEGDLHALYQKAREASFALDRLRAEVQKKELLLHCIVHDLKGPLSGIVGHLSLLESRSFASARAREIAGKALAQARRQHEMIRSVLELFSTEVEELDTFETLRAAAPDLRAHVRAAAETMLATYQQREIDLELDAGALFLSPLPVVGRGSRIERVVVNLLENALRYAPVRTRVEVAVHDEGDTALASVEDRGPGVSSELAQRLFAAPGRVGSTSGMAGLGLYSSRLAVERWGGSIGYAARTGGGARFWFRLRMALDPTVATDE